jgi:hypothetical protein
VDSVRTEIGFCVVGIPFSIGYSYVTSVQKGRVFPQPWLENCSAFRPPLLAIPVPNLLFLLGLSGAGVAQLVEHLICNQRVGGSIPSASSTRFK